MSHWILNFVVSKCLGCATYCPWHFFFRCSVASILLDKRYRAECPAPIPYPPPAHYETIMLQRHVQVTLPVQLVRKTILSLFYNALRNLHQILFVYLWLTALNPLSMSVTALLNVFYQLLWNFQRISWQQNKFCLHDCLCFHFTHTFLISLLL